MVTVPEAARRVGRNPETIRRWIRSGKLPSRKVGTQHLIEEGDLEALLEPDLLPAPPDREAMWDGRRMPDWEAIIRRQRASRRSLDRARRERGPPSGAASQGSRRSAPARARGPAAPVVRGDIRPPRGGLAWRAPPRGRRGGPPPIHDRTHRQEGATGPPPPRVADRGATRVGPDLRCGVRRPRPHPRMPPPDPRRPAPARRFAPGRDHRPHGDPAPRLRVTGERRPCGRS